MTAPTPYDEAAGMCPNCVTPWKCNGPHEPTTAPTQDTPEASDDRPDTPAEWMARHYARDGYDLSTAMDALDDAWQALEAAAARLRAELPSSPDTASPLIDALREAIAPEDNTGPIRFDPGTNDYRLAGSPYQLFQAAAAVLCRDSAAEVASAERRGAVTALRMAALTLEEHGLPGEVGHVPDWLRARAAAVADPNTTNEGGTR